MKKTKKQNILKSLWVKLSNHWKKYLTVYVVCLVSSLVCSLLGFVAYGQILETESNHMEKSRIIVLDAGHGDPDGGATSADGILEKDINLEITLKLRDYLEASGYDVIMTRENDSSIHDENATTIRQKKRSDLKNRANIIKSNEREEDNAIFVSIHQNKFQNPKYFGTQIFYSKNNTKSKDLATNIKDSIVGLIQPENTREIKPSTGKIYLLNTAGMPAVVVECGFLSNEEEAKKLITEDYQEQIAFCILCGISNYFANV